MAVNPLSLAECLRPWKNAGLHLLLGENALDGPEAGADLAEQGEAQPGHGAFAPAVSFSPAHAATPAHAASGVSSGRAAPDAYAVHTVDDAPTTAAVGATFALAGARLSGNDVPDAPRAFSPTPANTARASSRGAGDGGRDAFAARNADLAEQSGQLEHEEQRRQAGPAENALQPGRPEQRAAAANDRSSTNDRAAAFPPTWSAAWQELFARTRRAPILWSYAELGLDLHGQGSAERSACLRTMMQRLELPKGSSTFWPPALAGLTDGAAPSPEFAQGLDLLKPQAVILPGCGPALLEQLRLEIGRPFEQQISYGRLYILLPDFFALISGDDALNKSVGFLRAALSGLPALFR